MSEPRQAAPRYEVVIDASVGALRRVIGRDGSLTGYGGGLETKLFLLKLKECASES